MSSKVTITFQNIKAEIAHAQPEALLAYQNIQMVDIRLDPDSLNQFFGDSFGFSDAPVFAYSKAVADSIGMADVPAINVGKALTDSVSMSDSFSVSVAESLSINYVSGTLSLLNNSTMNTATFNG